MERSGVDRSTVSKKSTSLVTTSGVSSLGNAVLVALFSSIALLAGCSSSAHDATGLPQPLASKFVIRSKLPASSPLTTCVDPTPPKIRPLHGPIAKNFVDNQVVKTLRLDGGKFVASPPTTTNQPIIAKDTAYCNLLASVNSSNAPIAQFARSSGMAFGLADVTIAPSVATSGVRNFVPVGQVSVPSTSLAANRPRYANRLAWVAIVSANTVGFGCPPQPVSQSTTQNTKSANAPNGGANYQIIAIDATTGVDGVLYSASTPRRCGEPGVVPPSVQPAKIMVSLPWKLVKRGPGVSYALISYRSRPCDSSWFAVDTATNKPTVFADENQPSLVSVTMERTLATCGPATEVNVPLRSSMPDEVLPTKLVHAPVGAVNATIK